MIKQKRDSLERFIREQTIGPGINGYRFIDLENELLLAKSILDLAPIDYRNEIIDIVPAAVYSTGILFPEEIKRSNGEYSGMKSPDNNEIIESEDGSDEVDSQDSSDPDIEETDGIQLDQMYPKSMGFSCCLNEAFLTNGSLEFKIEARYYKKIKRDKEGQFNKKYGLLCEVDKGKMDLFLRKYQLNEFALRSINTNVLLTITKLGSEELTVLKKRVREVQKTIAEELFVRANEITRFSRLTKDKSYLSSLKSTIFNELKYSLIDPSLRRSLYAISQEIELIENIVDHLKNLIDANSGGYGLWESQLVQRVITINSIVFPRSLRKKSYLYYKKDFTESIKVALFDGTEVGEGLKHIFRYDLDEKGSDFASLSVNVQLSRDSRKSHNRVFVKIQLINNSKEFEEKKEDSRYFSTFNEKVNEKCFFGNTISLSNENLCPYNSFSLENQREVYDEDITTQFIYRAFQDFGIGHGCSVKWDSKTYTVESEYIPFCDTPDVDPVPRNKHLAPLKEKEEFKDPLFLSESKYQEFKWLSTFSDAKDLEITNGLIAFVNSYGQWIELKKKNYGDPSLISSIANQELNKCSADYTRMSQNIEKFLSGPGNGNNLRSFRLMNSAMFMQLWHSEKVKKNLVNVFFENGEFSSFNYQFYKENADDKLFSEDQSASWRAFQLAFILLNLDGIFQEREDEKWERRNEWVDLVWFPTGGGKTEAYLGLIALTIINRRKLHLENGGGTAAIMRYTLRLLTLQQFQRASLVIMALELLRRWKIDDLGVEPIYIGLWVGKNSIPNTVEDLSNEYKKMIDKKDNKIPFSYCPWCRSALRPSQTKANNAKDVYDFDRLHLFCDNNKCSFTEPDIFEPSELVGAIPVCLSDETIYQHPPALLFGTVDKFAQLAHKVNGTAKGRNKDSRRIFGKGNWEHGKPKAGYLPPDLIIQDELHLLLGPLGSAVALFESAVDQLCTRKDGTRPKVISSTATTRNTDLQIAALFDRKVDLFPKPGPECDDSFFAFYKRKYADSEKSSFEYISKRRYIGIIPTGRTQIWMQMRLAAIMMTHRAVFELEKLGTNDPIDFAAYNDFEKAMDYYHTTISYFNSLKEVGKTQSQVQSYILKELRRVFSRVIRPQKLMDAFYKYGPIEEAELTGRLSGEDVKNELKRIEGRWSAETRLAHKVDGKILKGYVPPEFVVATNMISVGIDVSRFNSIIMNSMPRNTAEYIQASSRVARDSYGLVLTIHHPFRARDVSHYEKFIEFHEKMYSYVEPISITPFTQKAVNRYLGLYLATILRHKNSLFVERNSAPNILTFTDRDLGIYIQQLTEYFAQRKDHLNGFAPLIKNLLKQDNIEYLRQWITEAFSEWKKECNKTIDAGKDFVFQNSSFSGNTPQEQLYVDIEEYEGNIHSEKWQIPMSLRVIEPEAAIKINLQ